MREREVWSDEWLLPGLMEELERPIKMLARTVMVMVQFAAWSVAGSWVVLFLALYTTKIARRMNV